MVVVILTSPYCAKPNCYLFIMICELKNLSVLVQNVRFERNRYLTERKSCFALDVFVWCWPLSIVRSSSCSDIWIVQNDQKLMAFVLEPLPRIVKGLSHNMFVIFSGHETVQNVFKFFWLFMLNEFFFLDFDCLRDIVGDLDKKKF